MLRFGLKRIDYVALSILLFLLIYLIYRVNSYVEYNWRWHKVLGYLINRDETGYHFGLLTKGLFYTLKLSFWSIIFSMIFGLIAGVSRTLKRPFFKIGSLIYVEINRNIPPLVLVFIFYFFIADQLFVYFDIEHILRAQSQTVINIVSFTFAPINLLSSFFAGVLTLAIYESAYIAEIVKAGIESVDSGQKDAAKALGLSKLKILKYVIMPQATKVIIPPLNSQFISTIKDSSIVSVVAIPELTFQGMEMMSATYLTYETWITVTFFYFFLTFLLSMLNKKIEKKLTANF
ncbi:MAG: polar amino acid transport system permease protein [Deferribacteres bacterium]|jgi:polar amino acid transport system permease protein|nr:polar amino acid transporter, inner rane subunit [Deferribacteraceae bacterium]MDK2792048.1 polar amino acid transport system permease protein [Deferribacteres bacterium]